MPAQRQRGMPAQRQLREPAQRSVARDGIGGANNRSNTLRLRSSAMPASNALRRTIHTRMRSRPTASAPERHQRLHKAPPTASQRN